MRAAGAQPDFMTLLLQGEGAFAVRIGLYELLSPSLRRGLLGNDLSRKA
ncbi:MULTISPECIES: hypothetical protein [Bradyrhizobium]|nr:MULTISPECIES: hypothetical protein [Bradyrhizobium]